MIKKLYNLKKKELDAILAQKNRLLSQLAEVNKEIEQINYELNHISVDKYGAINDFVMLSIHKNYLKEELKKLHYRKNNLKSNILALDKDIVELNKESEQYDYILKQMYKQKLKEIEKKDRLIAEDFIQAKFTRELNV